MGQIPSGVVECTKATPGHPRLSSSMVCVLAKDRLRIACGVEIGIAEFHERDIELAAKSGHLGAKGVAFALATAVAADRDSANHPSQPAAPPALTIRSGVPACRDNRSKPPRMLWPTDWCPKKTRMRPEISRSEWRGASAGWARFRRTARAGRVGRRWPNAGSWLASFTLREAQAQHPSEADRVRPAIPGEPGPLPCDRRPHGRNCRRTRRRERDCRLSQRVAVPTG